MAGQAQHGRCAGRLLRDRRHRGRGGARASDSAALFSWLSTLYGTIPACLIIAGGFVVVALIPLFVLMSIQRREEARIAAAAAKARTTQWINPATLSLGLQAARMVGKNRGLAAGAVGALLLGWVVSQFVGRRSRRRRAPKPTSRRADSSAHRVVALDAGAQHLVARPLPPVLRPRRSRPPDGRGSPRPRPCGGFRPSRSRRRPSCRGRAADPSSAPASRRYGARGCAIAHARSACARSGSHHT